MELMDIGSYITFLKSSKKFYEAYKILHYITIFTTLLIILSLYILVQLGSFEMFSSNIRLPDG